MIPRWNAKHIPEMKKGAHRNGVHLFRAFKLEMRRLYCWKVSDSLRNSFINFSTSNEALRARVPAALLPFST